MPAMLIAVLFRYIFAFRLFSEVWLMTGAGRRARTEVLAVYLYLEAFRYNAFGAAAATGWLLVLASLLLALSGTCAGSTRRCSATMRKRSLLARSCKAIGIAADRRLVARCRSR